MRTTHSSEDLQKFRTWKWGNKAGSLPPLQGKVNWELRLAVRADQNWVQSQRPDRLSPVITQQTQEIWGRPSLRAFFTIALLSDGAEPGLSQLNSIIQVSKLPHTQVGESAPCPDILWEYRCSLTQWIPTHEAKTCPSGLIAFSSYMNL